MKKYVIAFVFILLSGIISAQTTYKTNVIISKTAPMLHLNGSGGVINFYNSDISLTQSSNTLTLSGGNFALGTNSLTLTGSIGSTSSRATKGWFTNLEITNLPTVNGGALKTALSLTASDVGLGNVTNESKTTMFSNVVFSGSYAKIGLDTLATRAYSRLYGGGEGGGTVIDTASLSLRIDAKADTVDQSFTGTIALPTTTTLNGTQIDSVLVPFTGSIYDLDLGANNLFLTGDIGQTGSRIDNGYFSTITLTNALKGNVRYDSISFAAGDTLIGVALSDTVNYLNGYFTRYAGVTGLAGKVALADSNVYAGGYASPSFVDSQIALNGGAIDSSIYITVTRLNDSLTVLREIINNQQTEIDELWAAIATLGDYDLIPPRFESAYVSNDSLVIIMDATDIQQDSIPLPSAFTLYEGAVEFGLTSVDISNDSIFIVLDSTTVYGAVYTLDYTKAYPYMQDSTGNESINWTANPVTNNTEEVIPEGNDPPASFSSAWAWYVASYSASFTETGGAIEVWADSLGSGHDLEYYASDATSKPTLSAGVVTFDGTNDELRTNNGEGYSLDCPVTYYLVFKQITWSSGDRVISGRASSSTRLYQYDGTPELELYGGTAPGGAACTDATLDTWVVAVVLFDGTNSFIQIDGGTNRTVTEDIGSTNPEGISLGCNPDHTAFGNMAFKEVIVIEGDDSANIAAGVAYLKARYGIE